MKYKSTYISYLFIQYNSNNTSKFTEITVSSNVKPPSNFFKKLCPSPLALLTFFRISFFTSTLLLFDRVLIPDFNIYRSRSVMMKYVNTINPNGNYMFKVSNRNTRTRCEICSKLTRKTPERRQVSLLLTLNIFHTLF